MRTLAFSTAGGRAVKSLLGYRQHNWVTNLWNSSCKEKAVKGQERRREFCKIQEKCRQVRRNRHRRMSVGKVWRKAGMSYAYGNNGYVYLLMPCLGAIFPWVIMWKFHFLLKFIFQTFTAFFLSCFWQWDFFYIWQ